MIAIDAAAAAKRLAANARVFEALVADVGVEQARWKPAPEKWSILEVMGHLADEEAEDFRRRLDLTLQDPAARWPAIDPPRWAIERRYNEGELSETVSRFLSERERSVAWLRTLSAPDWSTTHEHPQGSLRAGDLLASWMDHDLIHVRQITRLHHEWLVLTATPFRTEYAGGF
jgi:hypothetical protein